MRVGAASIVGLLGFLTWRQATIYHDPETLWRSTIARNPESWMAYNNLGVLLAARGEFEQAIECYRRSLDRHVETKAIQNFADAHYNLAAVLLDKGENDQALTEASIAVRLQPNDSDAHVVLGNALLAAGQTDESITEYERALELKPESADAHYNLGRALQEKGGAASAADHYRAALQIAPETMEAHLNLGNILLQEGHEDGAVRQYRGALAVSPHSVKALNNLAWALATASDRSQRDGAEAVRLAEQANSSLGGADPIVLHTLGAAYAEMGQFEKATEADRQALELAVRKENAPLADEIHRTAQLYSQRLPYQKP